MKKIYYFILVLGFALILTACGGGKENLVISKIYTGTRLANNVIELYNNSDNDIDLSKHSIVFYSDGTKEVNVEIALEGEIKANSYYVIGSTSFDSTTFAGVSDKFDFVHDRTLPFNGDDAIVLKKKNKVVDFVGYTDGISIKFNTKITLIRIGDKKDYEASKIFDQFNFIKYLPDKFEYLKNDDYEIKTLEQLLEGPQLHDFYKDLTHTADGKGTGGAPTATLASVADGDTATFNYAEKPETGSHRYYYIDTPEKGGPNTNDEPWGYIATNFNRNFILKTSAIQEIRVQSIPDYGLSGGYGRNIGLIWVNGQLSQHVIVREGLSKVDATFEDYDLGLYWKDIPYKTFLLFAQENARVNGWGMHGYPHNPNGEKAPDWNYNREETMPPASYAGWTPHYDLGY